MGGCTSCGNKGGCDHRKQGMFAAIDEALARLYPSRRWGERDEAAAFQAGVAPALAPALAERLAHELKTLALLRPGGDDETCDYLYVLCFGRQPSIVEAREGVAAWQDDGDDVEELYLRVALSTVAPFAAVQQVAMTARRTGDELVVRESPRTGVFDPVLLPRFGKLVAVLGDHGVRHLDFGDLTLPPSGFDPGDYGERYGGAPAIANYLFFPQPASAVATSVVRVGGSG